MGLLINKLILVAFATIFAARYNVNCIEEATEKSTAVKLPKLGVGILDIQTTAEKEGALVMALDAGYRMIDIWEGDEAVLKNAMEKAKVSREEIFIVVKLNPPETFDEHYNTRNAVASILERLQTNYIDLLLINYPEFNNEHIQRWKTVISLKNSNKIKLLGVANFNYDQVMSLAESTGVLPSVVQLEINPFFQQKELVQKLASKGIAIQAYSPLTSGYKLNDPRLMKIAQVYDATTAQLLIQWCIQKGYSCITKSTKSRHLNDNINLGEFFIEDVNMKELDALEEGFVINYDPNDQTLYDRSFDSKGASNEKRKRGRRGDDLDEDGKVNDPNESEEFSEDEYSENDYIDDETAPQDAIYQPATNQKGEQMQSANEGAANKRDEF